MGFTSIATKWPRTLRLRIFEWNGKIAGHTERDEVLVTGKELLDVLSVMAGFALYDLRAGRAVQTVFNLIYVAVALPKGERTDTRFRKEIPHEGIANAQGCRDMFDQFPKEVCPGRGDRTLDKRTEKFVRLVAGFQPLWIVGCRHVVPHVSLTDTWDIAVRKGSTGLENTSTTGTYTSGSVRTPVEAWWHSRRSGPRTASSTISLADCSIETTIEPRWGVRVIESQNNFKRGGSDAE